MAKLAPGTIVVTATGGLGRIVRAIRRNGAPGYDVSTPDSPYTRFWPDWTADHAAAVIGITVCDKPRFEHHCGLTHVTAAELATLPRTETP